jgi:hypothetical protein
MIIGNDPNSFNSWLTAQQNCYFFSLGPKADSFEIITVEVALIFEISSGSPKISLVGRATPKPMCDDAEDLAGAGTDVRRCSNALGPRKNLQRQGISERPSQAA